MSSKGALDVAEPPAIRVICGPTGAGKSAVALWLATRDASTIISADSRQIFRGFDIGTAKPDVGERRTVPHRGIDIVDATVRYSAAAWAHSANVWASEAERAGRVPLVVGGTGFYLRALFGALFEEPAIDERRRLELQRWLSSMSLTELRRWAERLDPARADLGRTQLLRAIEIALLSGRRLSALHLDQARPPLRTARYLLVDPGAELAARITARLDTMLEAGWVEEVAQLASSVPDDAPAWKASGYRTLRRVVRGEQDLASARESILIETRQYAKRQRTWFRHQLPIDRTTRVDPAASDWQSVVEQWWNGCSPDGKEEETT
jgi:tRNA dimethylallyltransferase